ncbi:MAG: hypothetical protein WD035_06990 [Balneolaceae bacterium]
MQNRARFFAYSTWVVMISLAIIVFTNRFLVYVNDPGWIGLAALLGYGFVYLNFTYLTIRRYIRKIQGPTILHYILAGLIFLPPGMWIFFFNSEITESRILMTVVLAFSCGLGMHYGNKSGIKEKPLYIDKLEQEQSSGRATS